MWQIYSFVALFCFSVTFLLFKYASSHGIGAVAIMVYFFGGAFLCFAGQTGITRTSLAGSPLVILSLIAASVLGYAGNYSQTVAVTSAPNPGYALAIISTQMLLVAAGAALFFNSDFSLQKTGGMVLCTAGVILLSL